MGHVPELRRNQISIGTLDREGYSYNAKERKLSLTQGLVVIMWGRLNLTMFICFLGVHCRWMELNTRVEEDGHQEQS